MGNVSKIGLVVASCLVVTVALGQGRPSPDERAVDYRMAVMEVIGGNMGPVAGMARGRMPYNAAEAKKRVERVAFMADMVPEAFDRDTTSADVDTEAKPDIWGNKADFDQLAMDLKMRAQAAEQAIDSGDEAAAKKALGDVGGACSNCHDKYRED